MEDLTSGSQTALNDIRSVQSNIQAQLENFHTSVDTTFVKTSYVCDRVRNDILNYQDEPHLSKNRNNSRRIFIASELFINLCSIYAHVVDHEYAKIISDMVQWEKYKHLSRKISSKMQLELQRENYFIREAQEILLRSVEDTDIEETYEISAIDREEKEPETKTVTSYNFVQTNPEQVKVVEAATPDHEMNEILAGISFTDDVRCNLTENLSVIREGVTADTFRPESPQLNILAEDINMEAETSVGEPTFQQKRFGEIDTIRQILEGEEMGEIEQPENLLEPPDKNKGIGTETLAVPCPAKDGDIVRSSEGSEEWRLSSLEQIEEPRRKRRYLVIDEATIIPDYAAKALRLNKNINIERIQVFEGPPRILRAISANHLMKTPGRKSLLFKDVRSSKLTKLYSRNLEVEERQVEHSFTRGRLAEQSAVDISKARAYAETLEDVGVRTGMHSIHEKSEALVEVQDRSRPETDIPSVAAPPQESLIGIPLSRIINSTIEPPGECEMERINAVPILSTGGVQRLQGKSLEPRASPTWVYSKNQSPPSSKYRQLNYVYDKLEKHWRLLDYQGMEKCVTLREFFTFEADNENVADLLTVLRIVDKMSIQRKVILEYKDGDVLIRPFESPYVSDSQLLLREKEPIL